jgi:dienelactone hydrolase
MITFHFLTTKTPQEFMDIYIARPESDKKLPVIIVLMEAFGAAHA